MDDKAKAPPGISMKEVHGQITNSLLDFEKIVEQKIEITERTLSEKIEIVIVDDSRLLEDNLRQM